MFNMDGDVIGIISSILTRSGGFDGISFAISTKTTKRLLLEKRTLWTGLDAVMLHKYAAAFNVPQEAGLLVQRVAKGSVSDRLGLKGGDKFIKIGKNELLIGGDVILEVVGVQITPEASSMKSIRQKVQKIEDGGTFFIKILRAGEVKVLEVPL